MSSHTSWTSVATPCSKIRSSKGRFLCASMQVISHSCYCHICQCFSFVLRHPFVLYCIHTNAAATSTTAAPPPAATTTCNSTITFNDTTASNDMTTTTTTMTMTTIIIILQQWISCQDEDSIRQPFFVPHPTSEAVQYPLLCREWWQGASPFEASHV